jgi:hypothetical protein
MQGYRCMMMHNVTKTGKRTNNYLIGVFSGLLQKPWSSIYSTEMFSKMIFWTNGDDYGG